MSTPRRMPDSVEAHIWPEWFADGEAVTIEVRGASHLARKTVVVVIMRATAIETHWLMQVPIQLDADGNGTLEQPEGLHLGHEASVWVNGLIEIDEAGAAATPHNFPNVFVSIANPSTPLASLAEVAAAHQRIITEQDTTYGSPLGDPAEPGALEHRVLSVVQGLYMTTPLRLPGLEIHPIDRRPSGLDEREIINATLEAMGWSTRLPEDTWQRLAESRNPLAVIVCHTVWAPAYETAGELARDARDRVIALMALNRGATGQPVCLVIEQRQSGNKVVSKWVPEEPPYGGNLVGGFISGEDQTHLLRQFRAVQVDPLLKLCCDLYGEALHDRSADARFLRFWSILEFLSGARLPDGQVVNLRDGSPWPNARANTTSVASPRVYRYVADLLDRAGVDERSLVDPAGDLYEAVRVWYARRNATAHYGRFVVGDPVQSSQSWYAQAHQSVSPAPPSRSWLDPLRETVALCINRELMEAGTPSI